MSDTSHLDALIAGIGTDLNFARGREELDRLKADREADERLLVLMREMAGRFGIRYDGDQEFLIAVEKEIERLRTDRDRWKAKCRELLDEAEQGISDAGIVLTLPCGE